MFVHGNNLEQKMNNNRKYNDELSIRYLNEIKDRYDQWKNDNLSLEGPFIDNSDDDILIINQRVELLNDYKNFLDAQNYSEHFDSRSNLHSSVLEEFMYFLFKDIVSEINPNALIGKSHSFKDIFFRPSSFQNMLNKPHAVVEKKDHDFSIGITVDSVMHCNGSNENEEETWDIPAVAIECKTYLDKTMLQDVSTAAEQLKYKNPNAKYFVVAEWLKLTESINLSKYKIDQIYVLRKQRNTDREFRFLDSYVKNPIYSDVVFHLFNNVRDFLVSDWEGGISFGIDRGYLI